MMAKPRKDHPPNAPMAIGRLTPAVNLTEELVRRLAGEIGNGRLAPGARLPTEQEMMAATGVSRTVVREAISALRAQGLVVTRQGAGAFVSREAQSRPFRIELDEVDSLTDVLRVMEMRIGIEVEAAGLAAERRTAPQLAEIGRRLKAFERAIGRGDSAVDADFEFHKAIFAAVDNPYFLSFLEFLGRYIIPRQRVRVGFTTPDDQKDYLERIQREHVAIHAAIRARDASAARDAVRLHLTNSRDRYKRLAMTIEARRQPAAP
jgi:DNA-binding FadR family transcriptional regulator